MESTENNPNPPEIQAYNSTDGSVFADNLPKGCPPPDAGPASGVFYAAHFSNPSSDEDFKTAAEKSAFVGHDECQRRSNSIMALQRDAQHLVEAAPGRFRHVSEGVLLASHGLLQKTPTRSSSSHHSLWRRQGIRMQMIFTKLVYSKR